MAKKKREEEAPKGSPAWMATFSDLMNLLLCFFVLLYSMSTIDAEKYEIIRASLNNSISILSGGGSAIEEGDLISSGISQLNNLSEYTNVIGETSSEVDGENEEAIDDESESGNESSTSDLDESLETIAEQKEELTKEMYDEISEMIEEKNLSESDVELDYDPDYNYVTLIISGNVLFESGNATLKDDAKPILSKVGDILKVYNDYQIEIEGHTDNVPITHNTTYKDNYWLSTARALNAAEYLVENKGLSRETLKTSGRGEYDPIASNSTEEGRQLNRRVEIKIYNELSSY